MTNAYTWVSWNTHKKIYDLVLVTGVLVFLAAFYIVGKLMYAAPAGISDEILIMRALGTAAITLLHIILIIGPLHRLSPRFAPLLYNRRHMGVTMCILAVAHSALATLYYGGFGTQNPISAMLFGSATFSISAFPFELLGALALLIIFLMAATSHDFWLHTLGPRFWKTLHMGVYLAYALLIGHVALGIMQAEPSPIIPALLAGGVLLVGSLHTIAGFKSIKAMSVQQAETEGWIDAGTVGDIPMERATSVRQPDGSPIAVFRYTDESGEAISAMNGVCAHQGGPLGEGKVVNGCVTCPWHGYQYRPDDACSPPPFTEKLETHAVRLQGNRVLVNPKPNAPGTRIVPARPGVSSKPGGSDA